VYRPAGDFGKVVAENQLQHIPDTQWSEFSHKIPSISPVPVHRFNLSAGFKATKLMSSFDRE
jgi:hypothetical protein